MSLSEKMKVALDELRMQMLGTQVLFGFQLRGVFQEGLRLAWPARVSDLAALVSVVASAALLIAAPAQHRIVEPGNASAPCLH